jgi:hypothetical protein
LSQTSQLIKDFEQFIPELGQLMLELEAAPLAGTPCHCGVGTRTTTCEECTEYELSCDKCFITAHRNTPFHWAEVWDASRGFFVRHDISMLPLESDPAQRHSIQFGHGRGHPCKNPQKPLLFTIIDRNGIHSTRVSFCGCTPVPQSRMTQLMRARIFPGTAKQPLTGVTHITLKLFHIENLESKKAAFDFYGSLKRLTDNAFPSKSAVSSDRVL